MLLLPAFVHAQAPANARDSATASGKKNYVAADTVPLPARRYLAVYGDRIKKPGNERTTLAGSFTDQNGTTQATLIWEVPGSVRFDRQNAPGKPLIYNSATSQVSPATATTADLNIFESLVDDTAETCFYGFQNGKGHRLLGLRFRVDDGRTVNYQGPWYAVYAAAGPLNAKSGVTNRVKHYYFDSVTGLLRMTRYLDSSVAVTTTFDAWTSANGQSYPGQIVRTANGVVAFTFTITNSTSGPGKSDGIFSAP